MSSCLPKSYDVIIVGAGPAGIFCTLKLIDSGVRDVLLIDMGKDILCGWGGAGAFSDGKIHFSPEVGGFLGDLLDQNTLLRLLEEADSLYLQFGAPSKVCCDPSDALDDLSREARKAGMELVPPRTQTFAF